MERKVLYIWLSKVKGIGPVLASKLMDYFGRVDFIFEASYEDLLKVDGIGPKAAKTLVESKSLDESKKIYEKCNKLNIEVITRECDNYPKQLRDNVKAPIVLYVRGNLKEFDNAVCIVGSRRCTEYGKGITVELAQALSKKNIPIISGMAKGIDGYSHTVALHNDNYTIAVLGTGVDKCYPSEHLTLMNTIIENGAVISQFEPGTSNFKSNFLKRNELMAMLSEKIVVVEAGKDSGSIYTAHCGIRYGKEVYAVPGNINSKCSEGCNMLISEGVKPYLSKRDLVGEGKSVDKCEYDYKNNDVKANSVEEKILNATGKSGLSIDEIKIMLDLGEEKIEELLFEMEAKGQVKQSGGVFIRKVS